MHYDNIDKHIDNKLLQNIAALGFSYLHNTDAESLAELIYKVEIKIQKAEGNSVESDKALTKRLKSRQPLPARV